MIDGNVTFIQDGKHRQLTELGKDAEPVLSPDGMWVAFTRAVHPETSHEYEDCRFGPTGSELRRIRIDGTGEELLISGKDSDDRRDHICDFISKQFTSDGRYIYFLSPAWVTSAALHRYDLRTKKVRFLIPAKDFILLHDCKKVENRDNIIVLQHRYFVIGGSFDWYWLFDKTGKTEKGPIGEYETTKAARDASGLLLCDE